MLIPTNEIPLLQLPSQHLKIHKIIKVNFINSQLKQNIKQRQTNQKHQ